MRRRIAIQNLAAHAGETLGTSAWHVVDQAAIDTFACVTADQQWIHVDPERAAAGPFKGTIAHRYLTLSLCSFFLEQTLEVTGAGMVVNYGLDRVRFPASVPAGARARGTTHLRSVDTIPGGVQAAVQVTIRVEGAEKPSCVAEIVTR
jgi:acyl dehydratase